MDEFFGFFTKVSDLTQAQLERVLRQEEKSNTEINAKISEERRSRLREVVLLILGPGESGKSTLVKQFRLINKNQFTAKERAYFKGVIVGNVLQSVKEVIAAYHNIGETKGLKLSAESQNLANTLGNASSLTPDIANDIVKFISNGQIQKILENKSEFQLSESVSYYFSEAKRIGDQGYTPTDQDILHARVITLGIVETCFEVEGFPFKIVDVGGQRSQRRRWIHCFQDVTSVIFCVSLSSYDTQLREDTSVSSMFDCITLFEETVNNKYFTKTPFILLFNKLDLFSVKVKNIPITRCSVFSDYTGDPQSVGDSVEFIKQKFLSKSTNKNKFIYTHTTCATDTNHVADLFVSLKEILLYRQENEEL